MKTIEKFILPALTLVIGIALGYFACKNNQSGIAFKSTWSSDSSAFAPNVEITDRKLIGAMRDAFIAESEGLLQGENGGNLKGYHISKKDITDIIARDTNYDAIAVYLGKHPDHIADRKRIYTLMIMGSRRDPQNPRNFIDDTKHVYDHVEICPTVCGTFLTEEF